MKVAMIALLVAATSLTGCVGVGVGFGGDSGVSVGAGVGAGVAPGVGVGVGVSKSLTAGRCDKADAIGAAAARQTMEKFHAPVNESELAARSQAFKQTCEFGYEAGQKGDSTDFRTMLTNATTLAKNAHKVKEGWQAAYAVGELAAYREGYALAAGKFPQ